MEIISQEIENPFFSICIPQYNRTSYLIEACKVLSQQTFKNFEVCISDDRSNDRREAELIAFLKQSGMSFIYKKQDKNLRYDGNIRASIALATGKYCFLHGNDDCLASISTLEELHERILKYDYPGVIITNFEDWQTGQKHLRIRQSSFFLPGAETAATHFRNVAFVTGVIVDRTKSQKFSSNKWDGSEMYQMYIVSKIIASGSSLLELNTSAVRKDIHIPGESVDSYSSKEKLNPCPIVERQLPIISVGQVVTDAISPYLNAREYNRIIESIFLQLYLFTYPFWLIEYRRIQSLNYALGIALGFHPKNTLAFIKLSSFSITKIYVTYFLICITGITLPIRIFDKAKIFLLRVSKSFSSNSNLILNK